MFKSTHYSHNLTWDQIPRRAPPPLLQKRPGIPHQRGLRSTLRQRNTGRGREHQTRQLSAQRGASSRSALGQVTQRLPSKSGAERRAAQGAVWIGAWPWGHQRPPRTVAIGTSAPAATSPPRPRRLVLLCDAARSGCFDTHGRAQLSPDDARFCGRASPVPDLDGAGARTRPPAPARFSGCSCASSQALVSEGAAAKAARVLMWRVCKLRLRGNNRSSWNGGGGSLIVRRSLQIALSATARSSGTSRRAAAATVGEEKAGEEEAARLQLAQTTRHTTAQKPGGSARDAARSQASKRHVMHPCCLFSLVASPWWRAQPAATGGSSRLVRAASRKRQPLARAMGTLSLLLVMYRRG